MNVTVVYALLVFTSTGGSGPPSIKATYSTQEACTHATAQVLTETPPGAQRTAICAMAAQANRK